MPPEAFLMTGGAQPFREAEACPVMAGPHCAPRDKRSFMVADAAVADGTAAVRIAIWRCQFCNALLIGIGRPLAEIAGKPGTGVHSQEFAWLEEVPVRPEGAAREPSHAGRAHE
jgi:hypothetical protein